MPREARAGNRDSRFPTLPATRLADPLSLVLGLSSPSPGSQLAPASTSSFRPAKKLLTRRFIADSFGAGACPFARKGVGSVVHPRAASHSFPAGFAAA